MNAVRIVGDKFGTSLLYWTWSWGRCNRSAVVSNIKDYSFHLDNKKSTNELSNDFYSSEIIDTDDITDQFYLRMFANDVPGVMAEITSTLASYQISIEAVTQHEPLENEKLIPVVMITNSIKFKDILSAIKKIESMNNINGKVNIIRVFNDN